MAKGMDNLNEMRDLIHKQRQAIDNYMKSWEDEIESDNDFIKITGESFIHVFAIIKNLYMNLESMYIANEAWSNQISLLKDAIFELNEVKSSPTFQNRINELFSSYNELYKEQYRSFVKAYHVDKI